MLRPKFTGILSFNQNFFEGKYHQRNFFCGVIFSVLLTSTLFADPVKESKKCKVEEKPQLKLWFSGLLWFESFIDTRQTVSRREGDELLHPAPVNLDNRGQDTNDRPSFNMMATNSRLRFHVEGPGPFSFTETKALIETDFRGVDDPSLTVMRLREAYVSFLKHERKLLFGHTLHPLYILECRPRTVSYGKGLPVDTHYFCNTIRWTEWLGSAQPGEPRDEMSFAITDECRTARSAGPLGDSTIYARNGFVPGLYFQFRKQIPSANAFVGFAMDTERLLPQLVTPQNYEEHAPFMTSIYTVFARIVDNDFSLKAKFIYAKDGQHLGYMSGYAVKTRDVNEAGNPVTGKQTYAPLRSVSAWIDADMWEGDTFSPGFYCGYTKNLGAGCSLYVDPTTGEPITFGILTHIKSVTRFTPRLWYKKGALEIGTEFEWCHATPGSLNNCGEVICTQPVDNFRIQFAVMYFF